MLVDDEFSTGNTVLNTIRDLHARYPRKRYVVVALVDMRSAADAGRLERFAQEIGARVDLVAAASGTVRLPEGVLEKGQRLVAACESAGSGAVAAGRAHQGTLQPGDVTRVDLDWPPGLPRRRAARLHPRPPRPSQKPPCPPWPAASATPCPPAPAACSCSASKS